MSKRSKIPFNKPFIVGNELRYIGQAVLNGHLSGNGEYTKSCHRWLEERLGCAKAFLTSSCTAALEMAAILCNIGPGDEVIMPSFTFVSTANAFVLRGATPVFADIRPDTLNIDERLVAEAVTERTKAVVPVHYAGVASAMDEIMNIAEAQGLYVVEDAAQALYSSHQGRFLGTIGHFGCLSFHETKNVISGEGGALLVNDASFVDRAEIVWEKGTNRCQFFRGEVEEYSWLDIGSSFLPGELVGAFLYAQLEHSETIFSTRVRIAERYLELLGPLEERGFIRLPSTGEGAMSNGHMFYILARSPEDRTKLLNHLNDRGIGAVFHYVPLHSSPGGRKFGRVHGPMSVTEDISKRLVRLPLYFEMTDAQIDAVVEEIKGFYLGY